MRVQGTRKDGAPLARFVMEMKMGFRIRSDYEDDQIREASMQAYQEHLKKLCQGELISGDLLRYFYLDFFHDGWIEEIVFRNGTTEVQVKIVCPNIKRKTKDGNFEYINVPFLCTFKDVAYFKFERTVEEENECYRDPGQFTYLYSEIDTLPELLSFQPKKDIDDDDYNFKRKNSLIIEVLPMYTNSSSYIEIIFGEARVEAVETTAFQLMLASSQFEVPIYSEQKNP
jgi:hypothetical protein